VVAAPLGLAILLAFTSANARDPAHHVGDPASTSMQCAPAAYQAVHLPPGTEVDDIWVFVSEGSPLDGSSLIRVETDAGDRMVRVRGESSLGLSFRPALRATTYHVSVDPVFSAPTGACVERIELRSRGATLAIVRP
jgi:hypothetical protein